MNRDLKSIAYAFIAHGTNIYFSDDSDKENYFIAEKLVCTECKNKWITQLTECYFCGNINCYVYTCSDCNNIFSITNSPKNCPRCSNNNIFKKCLNESCPSNTNKDINFFLDDPNASRGIFGKNSSWKLSLTHCVYCSNELNRYISHRIFLIDYDMNSGESYLLNGDRFKDEDVLILKTKIDGKLHYYQIKPDSLKMQNYKIAKKFFTSNISTIIENIMLDT